MTLDTLITQSGLSTDELVRQADRHTLAVQAWLASRAPQAAQFIGQGVRASSTGIHVPLLNLALGCDYPPETPGSTIDDEIVAVKTFFTERGVPWYWWIGANPSPVDIASRLEAQGIVFDRPPLPAMVAALPAVFPALDSNITVWQTVNEADLKAASLIRRTAFRFPAGIAADYFEAMAESWLAGDPARLYLARIKDGEPAAIGALIMGDGLPGVYVMATLPDWGRRGLGKAILARMMNDAAAEGHRLIILTASRFGFPLYQQFGFVHIFDYAIYRPESPK